MKEQLLNIIFGYLYRPPMLYNCFDWAMLVGQAALLKWSINNIRGGTNVKKRRCNKTRL